MHRALLEFGMYTPKDQFSVETRKQHNLKKGTLFSLGFK